MYIFLRVIQSTPLKTRLLRHYVRIANQNHGPCSTCHRDIEAGDEYEGDVCVRGNSLWVSKVHRYCPDDFYEEELAQHKETERRDKEDRKKKVSKAA